MFIKRCKIIYLYHFARIFHCLVPCKLALGLRPCLFC